MDASTLERRYLKINKKLGTLAGVWPYQKHSTKWIRRSIVIFLVLPTYFTQYARLVVFPQMETLLNDYPNLLVSFGISLKIGNYFFNEAKLKILIERIYEHWRDTTTKDEYDIMSKYGRRGYLSVILYTMHVWVCLLLFICIAWGWPLLNIIMPLNMSQETLFIYPAYYFVDEKEYYYWIQSHMTILVLILGCIFCACDANYVYAVQHACGLLAVTRYRFKHACHEVVAQDENIAKVTREMYKNVCRSIQGHQRALEYVKVITSAHDVCMFISVCMLMISISASLLQISARNHNSKWILNCTLFVGQLIHMLCLIVQGQFVINAHEEVYNAIYDSTWYNSSPKTQALYILTLRNNLNPPLLTAGGFITLNLKTFAEVIKTSMSYYTVMQST